MKILGLDTSSVAGSCAVWEDGKILGEFYINTRLTHSQTMLPMVQALLSQCSLALSDMDCVAVTTGPGSFTGVRIGIAAVKGICQGANLPCRGVSTLEALAYNLQGAKGYIVPVLDARCQQVYTALFAGDGQGVTRLEDDCAMSLEERVQTLLPLQGDIYLVGDGAPLLQDACNGKDVRMANPLVRFGRAAGVCLAAYKTGRATDAGALVPQYLRLPQAQRELLKKQQQKGEMEHVGNR